MKFTDLIENNMSVQKNIKLPNILGNFSTYMVKVEDLVFNPYNDRFAKEIIMYQKTNNLEIDFDKTSQEFLFSLLTSLNKNKNTKKDIIKNGLLRKIVVDITGTIVDGNRRIAIIKEILATKKEELVKRFQYLEVVIIPRELNKQEIQEYETKLQISEDTKLEYDVINMYLKVDKHLNEIKNNNWKAKYQKVANLLGSKFTAKNIETMNNTFQEMKLYLNEFWKKPFNYNLLEGKEDQFKQIALFNTNFNQNNQKINIDFPRNYPNFVRLKNIFYIFISLNLRANPVFRDLVPKSVPTKTPLSRIEGVEKIENFIQENDLENWILNHPKESHPHFDSNFLEGYLSRLNNLLNDQNPSLSFLKKITNLEINLQKIYKGLKLGELRNIDNEIKKSLLKSQSLLEKINKEIR